MMHRSPYGSSLLVDPPTTPPSSLTNVSTSTSTSNTSASTTIINGVSSSGTSIRSFKPNTTSVEAEAMTIFRDLDKNLRSTSISQQCESIVRFSDLILKYPLPSIANTALLRLADSFRNCGNNFVRYWILVVFNEVRSEFGKVLNKNELTKRISSVLASNDPIARSLTLRMLASMSNILSERIDLQHKIETSLLNCVDDVEREASVIAIEQMCSTSKRFAGHILPELEKLIRDLKTPLHSKLQLIRVFRHMHGKATIAKKAFDTCVNLQQEYPSKDFVITILDTISLLTYHSIVVAKETFVLLFALLEKDARKAVKIQCLKDINRLARKLSDSYTITFPAQVLYQILVESPFESLKLHTLKLLKTLSSSSFMVNKWFANNPQIITVCQYFLFHTEKEFVDNSLILLINIARYMESNGQIHVNSLTDLLSTSICLAFNQRLEDKMLCECIVRYAKAFPESSGDIMKSIVTRMGQFVEKRDSNALSLMSLCLLKLTHKSETRQLVQSFSDTLIALIISMLSQGSENQYSPTVKTICVALLQSHTRGLSDESFIHRFQQVIDQLQRVRWSWTLYEIAKEAASLNYHNFSMKILGDISNVVESETYYYWISCLSRLCSAEYDILLYGSDGRKKQAHSLRAALVSLNQSLVDLRGSLAIVSGRFQVDLIQLRIEYVQLIQNVLLHAKSVDQSMSKTSKKKFKELAHEASSMGNKHRNIIYSYFDIDCQSQTVLSLMELQCAILSQLLSKLSDGSDNAQLVTQRLDNRNNMYSDYALYVECVKATHMLEHMPDSFPQRMSMLQDLVYRFLGAGFCLPKFFYHTQLNTSLQMEVEVNGKNIQKGTGNFVTTVGAMVGQGLAIKFSGYIQQENLKHRKRRAKGVCIRIKQQRKSDLASSSSTSMPIDDVEQQMQVLEEEKTLIVKLVSNSFQIQSMCNFKHEGVYRVKISTQIIDENDKYWNTFASERMLVNIRSAVSGGSGRLAFS